jgi:hypothetical protein
MEGTIADSYLGFSIDLPWSRRGVTERFKILLRIPARSPNEAVWIREVYEDGLDRVGGREASAYRTTIFYKSTKSLDAEPESSDGHFFAPAPCVRNAGSDRAAGGIRSPGLLESPSSRDLQNLQSE